jgi:hypothetical protein
MVGAPLERVESTQLYHAGMNKDGSALPGVAEVRYRNALRLFDEFVAQHVKSPDATALRGLERRFAEQVLIQPSYWSQIKSRARQIGERLARQFEQRCRKAPGWMDQPHDDPSPADTPYALRVPEAPAPDTSSTPRDDEERFIVGLVLSYYRRHPQRARSRLLDLLGEVLAPPPAPPPSAGDDEAGSLFERSQKGVMPLKRRR